MEKDEVVAAATESEVVVEKSTNQLLQELTDTIRRSERSEQIKTAAAVVTPRVEAETETLPPVVEKGLTSDRMDETWEDPIRKSFERLAKAMPAHFGHLGVKASLDNPYGVLRAKNADGSYVMKQTELNDLITAVLGMNSMDDPRQHGALHLNEWISRSGSSHEAVMGNMERAASKGQFGVPANILRKELDTTVGAALIRTDIEPLLREAFNRVFPAYEILGKIPSNGLKHTWNQITDPGAASLLAELGDFSGTADNNTYEQFQSTNIAVAAAQREIGLKARFASAQSGMNFNLTGTNNVEVMGALVGIANVIQAQIFQGNEAVSGKTVDDEEGAYNTLGFTGLRWQLKDSGYSINKGSDSYLRVLRKAVGQLYDVGATMSEVSIFASIGAVNAIDGELETFYNFLKAEAGAENPLNFSRGGFALLNGVLARLHPIPSEGTQAKGIGYYTYSAAATEDMYVLDPNGTKLPYLGSPGPTILELPTGWGNHLSNTFVPFIMLGLAVYVKLFNRKIRIAKTTI